MIAEKKRPPSTSHLSPVTFSWPFLFLLPPAASCLEKVKGKGEGEDERFWIFFLSFFLGSFTRHHHQSLLSFLLLWVVNVWKVALSLPAACFYLFLTVRRQEEGIKRAGKKKQEIKDFHPLTSPARSLILA